MNKQKADSLAKAVRPLLQRESTIEVYPYKYDGDDEWVVRVRDDKTQYWTAVVTAGTPEQIAKLHTANVARHEQERRPS